MDLYEYQARELLEEQGIPTPKAIFAQNSHEVAEAADQIGYPNVIKAQVKIGHRGQAGGVKLAKTRDESILASEDILPMTIHKHKVSGVLVAEAKNILHEDYVSISVDRSSRDFDVLATANGGTEVEEIAKEHPESVKRLHIDALDDFDLEAATKMAESIGFYHADVDQAAQILLKMWRCFKENDLLSNKIKPVLHTRRRLMVKIPGDHHFLHHLQLHLSRTAQFCIMADHLCGFRICIRVKLTAQNRHQRFKRACFIVSSLHRFAFRRGQFNGFHILLLSRHPSSGGGLRSDGNGHESCSWFSWRQSVPGDCR